VGFKKKSLSYLHEVVRTNFFADFWSFKRISRFDGLNFDCATHKNSNAFNCTNNFFDRYLPIQRTNF